MWAMSMRRGSPCAPRAKAGGTVLLRLEDIDRGRCRAEYADAIAEDLAWLGLRWDDPIRRQSEHFDVYADALGQLDALGLLYPCFCTRADIRREIEQAAHAPHGPDGLLCPGTCRGLPPEVRQARVANGNDHAIRLDLARAAVPWPLRWRDLDAGTVDADPAVFGDVVLARKDVPASYHPAVTVDDVRQGIGLVTRGVDLYPATHIQRMLQALLGFETPLYRHHRLLLEPDGKRLAKRDRSMTVRALREVGHGQASVLALAGCAGMVPAV